MNNTNGRQAATTHFTTEVSYQKERKEGRKEEEFDTFVAPP